MIGGYSGSWANESPRPGRTFPIQPSSNRPDHETMLLIAQLKAGAARYNAEIQVSSFIRDEIGQQIQQLENELDRSQSRRANEIPIPHFTAANTAPQRKNPKDSKEKKPRLATNEGSSTMAPPSTGEGSSKGKGKATKTKTRAARGAGEATHTAPPPPEEPKGKGKSRAAPKSPEPVPMEETESAGPSTVTVGDHDVEMEAAAAAGEGKGEVDQLEEQSEEEEEEASE